MLDLQAMRAEKPAPVKRKQVKTFLTDEAKQRLELAAQYVGCAQHEIVEALILSELPVIRRAARS
ncbi:hypothetical protein [Nostoc phage Nsp-JY18]